jgi:hypothetical protein
MTLNSTFPAMRRPKISEIRARVADGIALGGGCHLCDRYVDANTDRRVLMQMLDEATGILQDFGNTMPGAWKDRRKAFLIEMVR